MAGVITTWCICIYNKELVLRRTLETYSNPNATEMKSGTSVSDYYHQMFVEESQRGEEQKEENNVSETRENLDERKDTHSID